MPLFNIFGFIAWFITHQLFLGLQRWWTRRKLSPQERAAFDAQHREYRLSDEERRQLNDRSLPPLPKR